MIFNPTKSAATRCPRAGAGPAEPWPIWILVIFVPLCVADDARLEECSSSIAKFEQVGELVGVLVLFFVTSFPPCRGHFEADGGKMRVVLICASRENPA